MQSCKPENQAIIYQTLCILIDEPDVAKFNTTLNMFIKHWEFKESEFIQYFSQFYCNRPGIIYCISLKYCSSMSFCLKETWAKSHRHFIHGDTDTNMYLERYMNQKKCTMYYLHFTFFLTIAFTIN